MNDGEYIELMEERMRIRDAITRAVRVRDDEHKRIVMEMRYRDQVNEEAFMSKLVQLTDDLAKINEKLDEIEKEMEKSSSDEDW